MLKFRLYLHIPNSLESKPLQSFHVTRKQAEEFLKLLLDAGQPKGTKWVICETKEEIVSRGEC